MYEFPSTIGLIPDLRLLIGDLHFLSTIWLAASALGFGALVPLAIHRSEPAAPEAPSQQPGADLSQAA